MRRGKSAGGGGRGWWFGSVAGTVTEGSRLVDQGGEGVEPHRFEGDVGGGGVGAELGDGFGADDGGGDRGPGQQPSERHLVRRQSPAVAESVDLPGDGDLGVGEPRTLEALVAGDLTFEHPQVGEQAAVQRRVGNDRQPEPLAGGSELPFGGPVDQVVLHLRGDGCLQTPVVSDPQGLGDLPGGMVGQADVADLARPDQIVIGGEGLLQWRVRVGVVGVVEIDVVGLQTAETRLDLTDDVAAGQAPIIDAGSDDAVGLRRDHHVVAAATEGAAEDLLCRFTVGGSRGAGPVEDRHVAVHVGGVDEVDAEIDCGADDLVGVLRGGGDAEGGGAETDPGHLDPGRAEDGVLHQPILVFDG